MNATNTAEADIDRAIERQRHEINLALLGLYMERHEALRQKLQEQKRKWLCSVAAERKHATEAL